MYPNLEKIGVDYVQPTNRYVFPVLKSTCSYVKNSLFFVLYLEVFFSKQRKRYQLVCFLTRPILSPNSFGALHPQFDETVFECHFLFLLTLQVQVSSCLLPNFWGNFGASLFWGGAIWIFCFTHISLFFVCSLAIKFLSSHWTHQSIPKLSGFLIPSCVNFFWFYENHTICFIQVGTLQIVFMPKKVHFKID